MEQQAQRMVGGAEPPTAAQLADWLGPQGFGYWQQLAEFIAGSYPGVFAPDWQNGGKKHGWGLRYKKSKSFCTLIPERNQLRTVIVFGGDERAKAEAVLPQLRSHARDDYAGAETLHDGKWVGIVVDSDTVLDDVKTLLTVKRKPKAK